MESGIRIYGEGEDYAELPDGWPRPKLEVGHNPIDEALAEIAKDFFSTIRE